MMQHVQRIWDGPATVGVVAIGGSNYTISLASLTPCTLAALATRFETALELATSVGWTVGLSSTYLLTFALDSGASFTWTQNGGFGSFWGMANGTATSRAGRAWTAAAATDWGIAIGFPAIVPHRELYTIPDADPVGVLYSAHIERSVIVRHAPDSEAAHLLQSEPCIIYQGDAAEWAWTNLDGYIHTRPAESRGQASSPWVDGYGTVLEYPIRLIDLTTDLPS